MNKDLLLLVDGNALLYRAYHAFPKELTTPDGEYIGTVYGFTRILLSTLKTLKPYSVAVCFDLPGPTFRHTAYAQYKATRQKMPDDLAGQIERTHEIVEHLEFPIYTSEGFEADDVIGTLARQAVEQDSMQRVIILTGDQDIIQLVTDQVSVYSPVTSSKQPILYTPAKVVEKYGFSPKQMVDYKALRGDPSDNIPGVPGIGEVTATKLIQEFGTVEALYQAIDQGKTENIKPAVLSKLVEHKESALFSRELATISTDAPVSFNAKASQMELADPEKLVTLFKKLGFKSLMNDLPVSHRILSEAQDIFGGSTETPEKPESSAPVSESERIDERLEPILRTMEKRGVIVDCPYLAELEKEYVTEIEGIRKRLIDLAGEEFNPDSPQQVAHIFYEVLGIPTDRVRKGKTGYTTDASTMQQLAKDYPIAELLLQYRELNKLLSTYIKPLQVLATEDPEHRVHTSYAPDTSTGRLSSRNPNLQNIPIRSEQGRRLRQAFTTEPGWKLVAADYSQLELRIAAHLSGDPLMIQAFREGRDFHSETAAQMHVDRHMAKILNFSILYGKGPYGFSQDLGVSMVEAKQFIEQYFKTYSHLRAYLDKILTDTRRNGYAETLYGRRRPFPDINSANFLRRSAAEREAVNMPIQGTEADIIKLAMCELDTELQKSHPTSHLILTVHDELVVETPNAEVEAVARTLQQVMSQVVTLEVPLEVTVKAGVNWAEMQPISL